MIFNLLALALSFMSMACYAQDGMEKKIIKEFQVNTETEFVISHKFGDINIENWDDQKIWIEVTLIADTHKPEKAEKLFSQVDIDFTEMDNMIKVRTDYQNKIKQKDITVNYLIKMPHYLKLELTNKFGAVFINELSRQTNISIGYGSLKANKLLNSDSKPVSRLDLSYSSAEIEKCSWQNIDVKYSTLEIKQAKALVLDSRFSTIEIDDSHSVIASSKYDNYDIGNLQNLVLSAKFSNIEIGNVGNKIDLQFEYGNFEVGNVQDGFESINITNLFGDINVKIDQRANYEIDAEVQFSDLDISDNNSAKHIIDGTKESYKGWVGPGKDSHSKLP